MDPHMLELPIAAVGRAAARAAGLPSHSAARG